MERDDSTSDSRPPYRTVGAVLALAVLNLGAGWFCATHPSEFTVKMFDTFSYTSLGYASILGLKALGEVAASGSGLRGMAKVLMTDAKPGTAT
jgi:hypothetical protein